MSDDLKAGAAIAVAGLRKQGAKMRVIAENIANAESTSSTPGGDPYRRRVARFEPLVLKEGQEEVRVTPRVERVSGAFRIEYDASHPAADAQGLVKYPNVNVSMEMAAMKSAIGSYKANLRVLGTLHTVEKKTLDLLK